MTDKYKKHTTDKCEAWEATKEGISKAWDTTKEFTAEAFETIKDIAQESWKNTQEQLNNIEKAEHEAELKKNNSLKKDEKKEP